MDNNEILFWKVIHNKYIFKLILQEITTTQWISSYDNYKDFNVDNRKKFKDITSLYWMIKNKQFSLIKCKLEAGEHIEIDELALQLLFNIEKELTIENKDSFKEYIIRGKGYYLDGDEISFKKEQDQSLINKHMKNDTLSLLVKHKLSQLLKFDLIEILLKQFRGIEKDEGEDEEDEGEDSDYGNGSEDEMDGDEDENEVYADDRFTPNLELLITFTNEPFSLSIKKDIIDKSFEIDSLREPLIKFLFNNPQVLQKQQQLNKKFKQLNGESSKIIQTDEILSISLNNYQFLSIQSLDIQNKLLDSKNVKIIGYNQLDLSISNTCRIKEFYEQHLQMVSRLMINTHGKQDKAFKARRAQLGKLYLTKFDNVIKGSGLADQLQFVLNYAFETYSANAIKYLTSLSTQSLNKFIKSKPSITTPNNKSSSISNEFIKYYTSSPFYLNFKSRVIDMDICKYIYSIDITNNDYQLAIDSISNENFKIGIKKSLQSNLANNDNVLSLSFSKLLTIQDTEKVDWILENYENNNLVNQEKGPFELIFESCESIEYAKLKSPNYFNQNKASIYLNLFIKSINTCDIKSLKYVDDNFNGEKIQFKEPLSKDIKACGIPTQDELIKESINSIKGNNLPIFNFENQTTSNIIQLLEYLNSTGYKLFSQQLFGEFILSILSVNNGSDKIDLSKLTINFNGFEDITSLIFIRLISLINPLESIQIILKTSNPFSNEMYPFLDKYWDIFGDEFNKSLYHCITDENGEPNGQFTSFSHSCLYYYIANKNKFGKSVSNIFYCSSNESINEIIGCIELLVNLLSRNYNKSEINQLSKNMVNKCQLIINHLFKRLIKIRNINFKQVDTVVELIKSSWKSITGEHFKFQHNLYHSFYFLAIKSMKFIKLILEMPGVSNFFENGLDEDENLDRYGTLIYDKKMYENHNDFKYLDTLQYLNTNVFTYEFITSSSFNNILETLINQVVYSPYIVIDGDSGKNSSKPVIDDPQSLYSNSLDALLCYLLDIKEFQLFFKHLDIILKQLDNKNLTVGEFPSIQSSPLPKGKDCCPDLKPLTSKRFLKYSYTLLSKALKILDVDSFDKFTKFNSYNSIGHLWFYEFDEALLICKPDLKSKFIETIKHIRENHH